MDRPGSVLSLRTADDIDRVGQTLIRGRSRRPEMLETPQHVEVPLRREREPEERRVHSLSGAVRAIQLMAEEKAATSRHRVRDREPAAGSLVLEQRIEG